MEEEVPPGEHPHADRRNWRLAETPEEYLANCREGLERYSDKRYAQIMGWPRVTVHRARAIAYIPEDLFEKLFDEGPPSETMMAGFAEFERGLISERTAAALQHRKKNRRVYSSPPLGFVADDWGNLIEHAGEQKLIWNIKRLRKRGMTFHLIADKLNTDGHVGKKGGKFWPCTIRDICRNDIHEERPHD